MNLKVNDTVMVTYFDVKIGSNFYTNITIIGIISCIDHRLPEDNRFVFNMNADFNGEKNNFAVVTTKDFSHHKVEYPTEEQIIEYKLRHQ
jgi:hypothetical protein